MPLYMPPIVFADSAMLPRFSCYADDIRAEEYVRCYAPPMIMFRYAITICALLLLPPPLLRRATLRHDGETRVRKRCPRRAMPA